MANLQTELEQRQIDATAAITAANEDAAFTVFFHQHPRLNIRANIAILKDFIHPQIIDAESLEKSLALESCRDRLASLSEADAQERIERQDQKDADARNKDIEDNNARLKGMSKEDLKKEMQQDQASAQRTVKLDFTRAELLRLSGPELRKLVHRPDGSIKRDYQAEVNRIMRGA